VGPRTGVDRWGKSRTPWDSNPGPSSPQPVAVPTTLPSPRERSWCLQFQSQVGPVHTAVRSRNVASSDSDIRVNQIFD
jgi:hypothetical protein